MAGLRRLRWRLALAYAVSSAVGLVVLAGVVTVTDSRLREDALLADVDRLGTIADRAVDINDDGSFDTSGVEGSGVLDEADVYVVAAGSGGKAPTVVYRSSNAPLVPVSDDRLVVYAADSLAGYNHDDFDAGADGGRPVYVSGFPQIVEGSDDPLGSVLVVLDARPSFDEHRRLLVTVWGGVAALALLGVGLGAWLAGRSLRPSLASLHQQERFLADAAHELRTPLAALRTTIEAGRLEGADRAASLARAEAIAAETSATVDDLLLLARMDAGADLRQPERVRLDLLVDEVLLDFPEARTASDEVVVEADVPLVRRAVRNLVGNAFRHGGGLDVVVTVSVDPDAPGCARVVVADRGSGIEPSVLDTIFDRFVTGRRSTGSGLGMAIVHEIATRHGGSVTAANRTDGPGAEFRLRLPLHHPLGA